MYDSAAFDTDAFDDESFLFEAVLVDVPDVVGDSEASATTALQSAGFTVRVVRVSSETVPVGDVVSQSPAAGEDAPEGSQVTIRISRGPYVPGNAGFIGDAE